MNRVLINSRLRDRLPLFNYGQDGGWIRMLQIKKASEVIKGLTPLSRINQKHLQGNVSIETTLEVFLHLQEIRFNLIFIH